MFESGVIFTFVVLPIMVNFDFTEQIVTDILLSVSQKHNNNSYPFVK